MSHLKGIVGKIFPFSRQSTLQYWRAEKHWRPYGCDTLLHGLINYRDTKAKCSHLIKLTCKGTLRQVLICRRPPPSPCLGWSSDFVGSESGQIQSVKLLQNVVSNRTQHPPPPPSTHCTVDRHMEGGGEELNQKEG
jgi:hypothetical protein